MTAPQHTSPSTTRFLRRAEGRLAYDVQGSGPLVLLVPGMAELRSSYRFLAPALVAAGYTVVTTDLRGHGDSDTTFTSYGDPETASDISALITELGRPAVVVGNSLAAGAGVIAAADHPEQIAGLVLVGPFVRNPTLPPGMRSLFHVMTSPLWVATVWKAYMPSLYAGAKPADFAAYRAAVVDRLRQPGYGRAFSRTARQTDHASAEARLAEVDTPVLVVMGDRDPDFKDPAAEAAWIGEALRGEVVMVPDAGHYPHAQQPEPTTRAVLGFLATVHPGA
ncbi:alpha/beta fold hydrolase [Micromonospora rifamycinica]|uniref:Lysophospholipase, alpha-beta hydrolase superfamily n=1 Tax=Micromonospora rifamycinica TaxID=291594 RepID=A0A109IKT5_9ACTN|nr:alpha/beta hydrolase [Micromonospora rifamycinica]KWV32293.1 hydrolase [Micromonospora rifamycinica]SCG44610.1 Lysophospholipase, alpha-beta hydrolase superfamily [Micromonospora rifamycinica]